MAVRGDDDVLALLDEMGGGGPSSPSINVAHQLSENEDVAAKSTAGHQTICNEHLAALVAAYRLGPPSNPHVELARHRRHEKFKAGFYDLFRACAPQDPNTIGGKGRKHSSDGGDGNPQWERNKRIKSIIRSVWKGMPPHSVWERYQFSLKTLEAECVREMQAEASGSGGSEYTPPWCQHAHDAERLLQQLVSPTVHQINAWIVAGRSGGTIWEPLLPVQSVSSSAYEARSAGMQRIELKYRNGSMELLREEVEFQFRRALKQRKQRGSNAKPLSIDEIYVSLKGLEGDTSGNALETKGKVKKSKKEKKRSKRDDQNERVLEYSSVDKEEHVLRAIFQSDPFQKLLQKLHRKFNHLADESYSAFLAELQKLSNRLLMEEQGRSGGKKRKRKSSGKGLSGGMPKISYVEHDGKERHGSDAGAERQLMVTFAGVSMKINEAHKDKLQSLYQRTLSNILGGRDDERYLSLFPQLLFTILLRYDALEGAGLQSAIPQGVFHCLSQRFGCQWECFASPFNCWYEDTGERGGRYGSAFGDTDALFGSAGSFFGMDFLTMAVSRGCFQANPPFASAFIEKMCDRMNEALAASAKSDGKKTPLMFVIFVPAWTESSGWKAISSSPHLSRHVLLSQKDDVHYYAEGTQHRRALGEKGTHRIASFDTSVFFLQNDAAKEKWSLEGEADKALKFAFASTAVRNVGKGSKRKDTVMGRNAAKQPSSKQPPQATKALTKRERTNESHSRKDKSKVSQRKGKLVTGGQDEMSILASMGILDGGSTREKSPQSSGGGGQKKKKRRKK